MMIRVIRIIAKIVGLALGAYAGFAAGIILPYYLVDHGDVGSAALSIVLVPIGVVIGPLLVYFVLRQFD
jgi:hypothetical protein